MRARIGTLATGALLLAAMTVQTAADTEVTVSSIWNGPVNTWLCAPAASCSTVLDDIAPVLENLDVLIEPSVLADTVTLIGAAPDLNDPDAVTAFITANPDLFSDPDRLIELAEDRPAMFAELAAMPEPLAVMGEDGPPQPPPGFEDLFAGLTDIEVDGGSMLVFTDSSGRTIVLMSGASPAEADTENPSEGSAATAGTIVTATISGNSVEESGASHRVSIESSFRGNTGIISANQAAGTLNQQANVQVIAIGPRGETSLVTASSSGAADVIGNTMVTKDGERQTLIMNSFGGSTGLTAINQSAGHLNQQSNVATIAVGIGLGGEALALSDSDLESLSSDNTADISGVHNRSDVITGSFGGYKGVAQVTQSSGDGNIVRNNLTISVQVAP
jgi:hypothetical protein